MILDMGKLTGYTSSGSQIFQKMDKGTRIITTMTKDGNPIQEIRLKSINNDIQGAMVKVRDFRTGLAREYSDLTDLKSDDKFRSVVKRFIDKIGNKIRIAVTKSKNGKKIEVAQNYEKANGEVSRNKKVTKWILVMKWKLQVGQNQMEKNLAVYTNEKQHLMAQAKRLMKELLAISIPYQT